MKKKKEKIKGSIKENISLMSTPLMSILPGQISFFVLLSIIPLISLLVMFASKLSLSFDSVTNFITHYVPTGVSGLIISIFEQQKVGTLDILFIITAFYIAAKATHSIIIASTQIYGGKQRNFVRTRIKAIIMLIILIFLVLSIVGILSTFMLSWPYNIIFNYVTAFIILYFIMKNGFIKSLRVNFYKKLDKKKDVILYLKSQLEKLYLLGKTKNKIEVQWADEEELSGFSCDNEKFYSIDKKI